MAGLDDPTVGIGVVARDRRPRARCGPGPVAVVFQGPSLLPPLTVLENVALPLILGGARRRRARDARRARRSSALDLAELADKLPEEISGGQAQRVAVARALAGAPRLLLADEPTGQLDRASGAAGGRRAARRAAEHAGAALVVATHDPTVAERLAQRWEMHSGRLVDPAREPAWSR